MARLVGADTLLLLEDAPPVRAEEVAAGMVLFGGHAVAEARTVTAPAWEVTLSNGETFLTTAETVRPPRGAALRVAEEGKAPGASLPSGESLEHLRSAQPEARARAWAHFTALPRAALRAALARYFGDSNIFVGETRVRLFDLSQERPERMFELLRALCAVAGVFYDVKFNRVRCTFRDFATFAPAFARVSVRATRPEVVSRRRVESARMVELECAAVALANGCVL